MKNAGKSIREAYMSALTGIVFNTNPVTVYEFLPIETLPDNYIYINDIQYNQTGNNHLFIFEATVTIDIVTKQYKKLDYDIADGIGQLVQDAILPFPFSSIQNVDFQIIAPTIVSANYIVEPDGATFLVRKLIRFSQTLIQK
jgi:hypothetical protein